MDNTWVEVVDNTRVGGGAQVVAVEVVDNFVCNTRVGGVQMVDVEVVEDLGGIGVRCACR